jgi:hypothetical protein
MSTSTERIHLLATEHDHVAFEVVVVVLAAIAPRVALRSDGSHGAADVLGVEERGCSADGRREIAFRCEAERGDAPWKVIVVVERAGAPTVRLAGPDVPARSPQP